MTQDLPEDFLRLCRSITSKRAKVVIDHIIEYGHITTEELKSRYSYDHPPRAIRDVREQGIPLETYWVTSSDGRRIGAYRFGDMSKVRADKLSGRTVISKNFKQTLIRKNESKCAICHAKFEERYLQTDHRVPYEIAGDPVGERNIDNYMLLCGSDNRGKSWSCEHCRNWEDKDENICRSCYWAYPENYTHVAMRNIRRADVLWNEEEINLYERLKSDAAQQQKDIPTYIKELIAKYIEDDST